MYYESNPPPYVPNGYTQNTFVNTNVNNLPPVILTPNTYYSNSQGQGRQYPTAGQQLLAFVIIVAVISCILYTMQMCGNAMCIVYGIIGYAVFVCALALVVLLCACLFSFICA